MNAWMPAGVYDTKFLASQLPRYVFQSDTSLGNIHMAFSEPGSPCAKSVTAFLETMLPKKQGGEEERAKKEEKAEEKEKRGTEEDVVEEKAEPGMLPPFLQIYVVSWRYPLPNALSVSFCALRVCIIKLCIL